MTSIPVPPVDITFDPVTDADLIAAEMTGCADPDTVTRMAKEIRELRAVEEDAKYEFRNTIDQIAGEVEKLDGLHFSLEERAALKDFRDLLNRVLDD